MHNAGNAAPTESDGSDVNTRGNPIHYELDETVALAPKRTYAPDEVPEFRVHPIVGWVPDIDISDASIGNSLKHYVGHEEVPDAAIEYRSGEAAVWLDANDPGRPAWRRRPPLTPAQVDILTGHRSDLADVPYAEPLVFLAHRGEETFWASAVAAGWAPTERDLVLLTRAQTMLEAQCGSIDKERA